MWCLATGRRVSTILLSPPYLRDSSCSLLSSLGKNNGGRKRFSNIAGGVHHDEDGLVNPSVEINFTQHLINGQFVDAASGKTFPTYDPRNGEVIAQVAEGDEEDINRAVAAARKAFDEGPWPRMTAYERCKILLRFADLVEKNSKEIAALESWNSGKPYYSQSLGFEIPMLIRLFRYYAGWADKIHGMTVQADGKYNVQTLHEPIGVAGQILPWNFPLLMFAWKVGPALACGNTLVLKPSELTPLTALYAANLLHEAGLPPGVLNVVPGFGAAGSAIATHMDVDKVAFTGSTETGKIIMESAAKSNLKAVTLELGGKSPFIVCEDADIDDAVANAHDALFFNQGQVCYAGSRTYVHERLYDEFVEKARALALRRVIGDPFKHGVQHGPQIDSKQFEKILAYIRSGIESNAKLECGGQQFGNKGYFIHPTVFSDVQDDMLIAKDEIFGPVQSILKFKDNDEVIRRANATNFGLTAGVFTKSLETANTMTRALKAGTVYVNCYGLVDAAIPYGGYKMSGIGREKGIYSLHNYLQVKAAVTPLKNPAWL
ncbi:hypothetical protein CCACVL1_12377 [Corchorus capsularis]|uniref:aldehyde dehydrogenase (NAD(+)) n=1 Tax=Corchorus capsularis TaxID=210143 RepID=A0A1R3IG02_COCAP|nr:hypothetical protein CCACVL1_12377 [Corchorus capsularis]